MRVPLGSLQAPRPDRVKARFAVELSDPRSEQVLVVTSDQKLVGYQLDREDAGWGEGQKKSDGVLLGALGGKSYVCFVELKSSMKLRERGQGNPAVHALDQLLGTFEYFHPRGTASPGDGHHDAWRTRTDALQFIPSADHEVIGIAVGYRHVPRPPPTAPILTMGTKLALRAVVHISTAQANRAEISFERLLLLAGIRP